MKKTVIDAPLLARMFMAGAKSLEAEKEYINELNVFPVPDGDTGTNMCMTIMSAVKEVGALGPDPSMHALAKAISGGSLRGARGNSGVILSQLFRGFTRVIDQEKEIDRAVLSEGMDKACETAYKAVMKPKEGTILTVAKAMADKAAELAFDESCDMESMLAAMLETAEDTLARTPEMLPVLKEAGVVDSGGQGLVEIFRGACDAFLGKEGDYAVEAGTTSSGIVKISKQTEQEIRFGYCTEFIIVLNRPLTEEEEYGLKAYLQSLGDSIVMVADDEIVKIHVHTNDPGLVLQKALTFGSLSRIKIDNMREEHEEKLFKDSERLAKEQAEEDRRKEEGRAGEKAAAAAEPEKKMGFVAVTIGDGLKNVFLDLGADSVIEGGQTMNPSTEDILKAVAEVNAENIFIFPNNKNIILAANQAADLTKDRKIFVVPTKTIPQGISALINFIPELSPEENFDTMKEAIGSVKTGQVTYSVRDTVVDGKKIGKGDYMGIGDSSILSAGKDMDEVLKEMLSQMVDEDSSFISIYYGEEITEEEAGKFGDYVKKAFPDCDMDLTYGGQPVYYYIISVE